MEIEDHLMESHFDVAPSGPGHIAPIRDPNPNDPPWTVLTAFGVWAASVLFVLIIPTLFLLPYLATLSPPITETEQIVEFAKTDPTALFLQILAILPAHLLTLAVVWLVATRGRKYKLTETLGLSNGGLLWWHYIAILVGFFVIAGVVGYYFPEQDNDLIRILKSSRSAVYIVAFVATFTAPVIEEFVYRGVIYSAFQRTFGVSAAFLFVTLLFALVHVPQYYPSYSTIFLLTLLSVILTLVRVKTSSLLPCIILHTLFNGFQSVLLILEPYIGDTAVADPSASIFHLFR
ncbi:MAG: type II CAAX endopeptidase family protein [Pyrinomonadaceae bacterium]